MTRLEALEQAIWHGGVKSARANCADPAFHYVARQYSDGEDRTVRVSNARPMLGLHSTLPKEVEAELDPPDAGEWSPVDL